MSVKNVHTLKAGLKRTRLSVLLWKAMRHLGIQRDKFFHRRLLHVFHTKSAVHAVAFSGSGDKLAIGTAEHHTMVWELSRDGSGLRTEPLLAIAQSVREGAVNFSGDGQRLAVGSGDTVQVGP